MKLFATEEQRALAFVAMKELEKMLNEDGDLSPNSNYDVGGQSVTVTIPDGVSVSRSGGENGDGIEMNSAMQNTYGYAVMFMLVERLQRFCQHKTVLNELHQVIMEVSKNRAASTETVLKERNQELYADFEQWKENLRSELGEREQKTPRKIKRDTKKLPTIKIN